MKIRVYLSGGMEYAKNEGIDWRNQMENWLKIELGHSVFNPNKESDKLLNKLLLNNNFRSLKSTNIEDYFKITRKFVDIDTKEIAFRSNYVICYWDKSAQKGAGTKGELTIARFFKKPVYLVTKMNLENIPGWILGCVTHSFKSFSQLKKFLTNKYNKKIDHI